MAVIIGSARIDENGNAYNTIMDKALAEAAREQILIASEYLTEEQKNELRDKGINV